MRAIAVTYACLSRFKPITSNGVSIENRFGIHFLASVASNEIEF